jgi:predicted component of type VI protein secretion system
MRARLRVVQGKPQGKHLYFPPGDYYFGRGEECQVRPNSPMVSRQHCLLRVGDGGVWLRDLGSRNGTLVNGRLLDRERQLKSGDQIQIGPLVFELHLEAQPTTPSEPPLVFDPPPMGATDSFKDLQLPDLPSSPGSTTRSDDNQNPPHGKK